MQPNRHRENEFLVKLSAWVELAGDLLVRGGLVAAALCTAYLLVAIFGKQIFEARPGPALERVAHLVEMAGFYLQLGAVAACLVLVLRKADNQQEIHGFILMGGLAALFLLPPVVRFVGAEMAPAQQQTSAVRATNRAFFHAGVAILATLIWPALKWLWAELKARFGRRKTEDVLDQIEIRREEPKVKSSRPVRPHVFSPCWHLPYCRDYLLEVCPAFLRKRRCWKIGVGCFCDPGMIENMIAGVKSLHTRTQAAYLRSEIEARTGIANQRRKRPPCKRCFNYVEHQHHKFAALSPLAYPLVVGVMWFGYPYVMKLWNGAQELLLRVWQAISLAPQNIDASPLEDVFGNAVASGMFTALLGMFLLLGVLRFIEIWCYKWRL
jgi:hypothetical protein